MKTTIVITKETRDKLSKAGRKGQTYDNIINELLRQISKESSSGLEQHVEEKRRMRC